MGRSTPVKCWSALISWSCAQGWLIALPWESSSPISLSLSALQSMATKTATCKGANSESSGNGPSIPGVDGAGPANGGQPDTVSSDSSDPAPTTYGSGSSGAGSSSTSVPSETDKRRKKSFLFWVKK